MMNDIEKAIKTLKDMKGVFGTRGHRQHSLSALDLAISALEKQIPKKPIITSWSPAKCPSCGMELSESLGDGYYKHLYGLEICNCGQKLSWESEVEHDA